MQFVLSFFQLDQHVVMNNSRIYVRQCSIEMFFKTYEAVRKDPEYDIKLYCGNTLKNADIERVSNCIQTTNKIVIATFCFRTCVINVVKVGAEIYIIDPGKNGIIEPLTIISCNDVVGMKSVIVIYGLLEFSCGDKEKSI